jgi:hypothetical protein
MEATKTMKTTTDPDRSAAARLMGQARTEKKAAAVRANGAKGGRPVHVTAAEVLALPGEALPGLYTDDPDDETAACWDVCRQLAAGEVPAEVAMAGLHGRVLWATCSRWPARRRVVR